MKKIVFAVGILIVSSSAWSQDRIVLLKGDTVFAEITKKAEDFIEYRLPGENVVNVEKTQNVHKIILQSGRTELINAKKKRAKVASIDDWENVSVVFDPKEVAGMKLVKSVVGKSNWGGMASEKGGRKALEQMRKEAAENQCSVVLITDGWDKYKEKPISGYGRGVKLKGEIYK